ncbi:AAA family ATPase [Flagellimonas marinaquae]|uniref:AAA family ATPase n=1 Tax=Flagellimonas marinaquae TaxID=254955 RepID=UPI00207662F5|nr:ATP-dependent Clp protease ATP-binding subunit [Allomuricauda aquimarina]USD26872.1 ATP-dependent Clp protease ATP-binding subunit [Allomuricauda aquimarina]
MAKSLASKEGHTSYGVAHLAISMLCEPTGLTEVLKSMGKNVDYIQEWFDVRKEMYKASSAATKESDGVLPDKEVSRVLEESERSKIKLGTDYIDAVCVFVAIVRQGVVYNTQQLDTITVNEDDFLSHFNATNRIDQYLGQENNETIHNIPYCSNYLSKQCVEEGELVVGRDKEIRNIFENLQRKENKGTLIIGDSGVGKTAIIKSLAYHIINSTNAEYSEMDLLGLNASKLLANCSSPNEVGKKLSDIFDKVEKTNKCILVIDDIQILLETEQSASNIANLIAAQLSDGKLNLIATISGDAYRKTIEKHSLNRKLVHIQLEELESLMLAQCMENHKIKLTAYSQIKIEQQAIDDAINFSKRYFKESKLPHTAIDLLDKTLAAVRKSNSDTKKEIETLQKKFQAIESKQPDAKLQLLYIHKLISDKVSPVILSNVSTNFDSKGQTEYQKLESALKSLLKELSSITQNPIKKITGQHITAMVANITGIPIGKIQAEEKDRLLNIDAHLQQRVKGQNHAIKTLSDAIIESRSGLSNPKQPIGSFFFLGPTGTGKTELTKALAELLFNDEQAMIRFDMSEFKEEHSAALLYGAPPGYVGYEEGGMLVNKIRQKPYSVVLFDEIEKAHSSIYDVFLQIMDEGKIHDKLGREGDFSNAIIIFTSNIGSDWIAQQFEKGNVPASNHLIDLMSGHFRPEFLGRLTEVVPFSPIHEEVAQMIFKLHLGNLQKQLKEQKDITLTLTPETIVYLSEKGYSIKYGARPIAGIIRTYIKKVVSRMIVAENIVEGDTVSLDYKEGALTWEKL